MLLREDALFLHALFEIEAGICAVRSSPHRDLDALEVEYRPGTCVEYLVCLD